MSEDFGLEVVDILILTLHRRPILADLSLQVLHFFVEALNGEIELAVGGLVLPNLLFELLFGLSAFIVFLTQLLMLFLHFLLFILQILDKRSGFF